MKKKLEQTPPSGSAVYLVSLGCSKNLVDTEVIAGSLLTAGYLLAFDPEEADLYLINSCAFIPAARAEAVEAIEEALGWKAERPGRRVVVAGCLPEWDKPGEFPKRYPEVDLWTGVNDLAAIAALLDRKAEPDPRRARRERSRRRGLAQAAQEAAAARAAKAAADEASPAAIASDLKIQRKGERRNGKEDEEGIVSSSGIDHGAQPDGRYGSGRRKDRCGQ